MTTGSSEIPPAVCGKAPLSPTLDTVSVDWLAARTRAALGWDTIPDPVPLPGGGSDRWYYRGRRSADADAGTFILCHYGTARAENALYAGIARFLGEFGLRVPGILGHDPESRLLWMEDLGDIDLYSLRNRPWAERRALYRQALEQAARLHAIPRDRRPAGGAPLSPAFDEGLYRWEQDYFFERCLGTHFHLSARRRQALRNTPALRETASFLAGLPRVLVHRDFQSQNLLVHGGSVALIDFQGMREGLAEYDLASLLHDPYVSLTDPERDELLTIYAGFTDTTPERLRPAFDLCVVQRMMQVLGAYGFLGWERGHTRFLQHIPPALASLRRALARVPGLEALGDRLDGLRAPAGGSLPPRATGAGAGWHT